MDYSKQNAKNLLKVQRKGNLSKASREAINMYLRHYGYRWQQVKVVELGLEVEKWQLLNNGVEFTVVDALTTIANS